MNAANVVNVKWQTIRGKSTPKMFFVVGTGRSGTHWLGHMLADHPQIRCTIERPPMFRWVRQMASDPRTVERLLPRLLRMYRIQAAWSAPRHYADKSHPNLWLVENLAKAFPSAVFIGIERSPYGVVASMMRHAGVSRWFDRWDELPIPNRFLGITSDVVDGYADMSPAMRCALRWQSHHEEMMRLESLMPDRLVVVEYEQLARRLDDELGRLSSFVGLDVPLSSPPVAVSSIDKWKGELSAEQIRDIDSVITLA